MAESDLDYAKVTGRFALTAGDTDDAGDNPDIVYCDEGTVEFTPLVTFTKVAGGSPAPFESGNAVIVAEISDADYVDPTDSGCDGPGYLTYRGKPFVMLVDLTSAKVNPNIGDGKATHSVAFKNLKADGTAVNFPPRSVRVTKDGPNSDGENNLVQLLPVVTGSSTPITVGARGVSVESATVSPEGELVFAFTDGTEQSAGDLPGTAEAIAAAEDATAAAGTATVKAAEADSSATDATAAKTDAVAAKTDAETAKSDAETARGGAEDARDDLLAQKAQPSGLAPLDAGSRVPQGNLPVHLDPTALTASYAGKAVEAKVSDRVVYVGGTPGADAVNIKQGHSSNAIASDLGGAVIIGGGTGPNNNVIGGDGSATVGTATPNAAQTGTGAHYSAVGGYDVVAGGLASIVLGFHNYTALTSTHGTIGGGSFQKIGAGSDYGTISGGTGHEVTGDGGTVGGGHNNKANALDATVAGGTSNQALAQFAVVGGGTSNTARNASSVVNGGNTNTAQGDSSVIGGGTQNTVGHATNTAWGTYSRIGGGFQNNVGTTAQAQYATLGGGRGNSIQTDYGAIPGGRENQVKTRNYGHASGYGAVADKFAQHSQASGFFTTAGDAQASTMTPRIQTTDATPTAMLLDGGNWKMGMTAAGNLWAFTGLVVAHRTGATGDNAAWKIEGALTRDATATGRLVGVPTVTPLGSEGTSSGWTVAVSTNASGELVLTCTGEAGKTIRWVARVSLVEVAGS